MESFTKLFASITDSTIWGEDSDTRVVWVTLLAMADRHGYVGASLPGLANRARVSLEGTEAAIAKFLAPDPYSRSQEYEGRRIEVADRGWRLLNYEHFRALRDDDLERDRARIRKQRQRDKAGHSVTVPECPPVSPQAEAEAEAEKEKNGRAAAAARVEKPTEPGTAEPMADIMAAVRLYLYAPDGQPPAGWFVAQDVSIAKAKLRQGTPVREILDAIEGLALLRQAGDIPWLRPGEKATLKALYHTRSGAVPMWTLALNAVDRARTALGSIGVHIQRGPKKPEAPAPLSGAVADALTRLKGAGA